MKLSNLSSNFNSSELRPEEGTKNHESKIVYDKNETPAQLRCSIRS